MVVASAVPLSANRPRRISILGATGSIGTSTLAVIAERAADFEVVAVTANDNALRLAEIAKTVGARLAAASLNWNDSRITAAVPSVVTDTGSTPVKSST